MHHWTWWSYILVVGKYYYACERRKFRTKYPMPKNHGRGS
jgi:hypothetical protein